MEVADGDWEQAAFGTEFGEGAARAGVLGAVDVVQQYDAAGDEPVVENREGRGGWGVEVRVERDEDEAGAFAAGRRPGLSQ